MLSTTTSYSKKLLIIILLTLGSAMANSASAQGRHHGHHSGPGVSWSIGLGLGILAYPYISYSRNYYPGYYPAYYARYQSGYYPEVMVETTVVTPAPGTVYVRRADAGTTLPEQSYSVQPSATSGSDWYYCHNPDGFYPSIKSCPSGWQRVPAQAPSDR